MSQHEKYERVKKIHPITSVNYQLATTLQNTKSQISEFCIQEVCMRFRVIILRLLYFVICTEMFPVISFSYGQTHGYHMVSFGVCIKLMFLFLPLKFTQ